eukprot:4006981-Amphidinium_carterae.1
MAIVYLYDVTVSVFGERESTCDVTIAPPLSVHLHLVLWKLKVWGACFSDLISRVLQATSSSGGFSEGVKPSQNQRFLCASKSLTPRQRPPRPST